MPAAFTGLARVTIHSPQRRVDVALPDEVPLAELLPELLERAGVGLADDGEGHGGWLLRRADGTALSPAAGLAGQGVRDGVILHLVPARTGWPEPDFDDVVEAIAAGARRHGPPWSSAATRRTALCAAGAGIAAAVSGAARADLPLLAGLLAAALVLAGAVVSRAYGDGPVGATLAGYGLPCAAAAGWLAAGDAASGPGRTLVAATAVLLAALVGAIGVAYALPLFVAGMTAGLLGVLGALLALALRPAAAAAIGLAVLTVGVAGVPLVAIRIGGLPLRAAAPADPGPDPELVFAAVARTDELLAGMLLGCALGAGLASLVLARSADASGLALLAVAGVGLLLRSRVFVTVRQRLPLLGAGLAGLVLLALFGPGLLSALLTAAAVAVALAGQRPLSPYLRRAADVLDALCVIAVIPLAAAVLGLYGLLR